jgi:L-2-hydroxyglutarate oxidase LhgO
VVGLAIAAELAPAEVLVLEKNRSFGLEASSRHSEVVHAGIPYPDDSLKARLCLEGNALLYEFCEKHGVQSRKLGKIFSAVEEDEMEGLEKLYQQGRRNGVKGLTLLSRSEIRRLEPNVQGIAGMLSPSSGIADSYSFMQALHRKATSESANFVFNCEVIGIEKLNSKYRVTIKEETGISSFSTPILINSAGLNAEKMAELAGTDIAQAGYKTYLLKGDYFSIAPRKWGLAKRLIYPIPGKVGVGIHNCIAIDGRERLGPYEYYVNDVDYKVDEGERELFYNSAKTYFPFLELDDLEPESSGIRPLLQSPEENVKDFVIAHEDRKGFPGLIDLIGIESPGFTSSLAIGSYVKGLVQGIQG